MIKRIRNNKDNKHYNNDKYYNSSKYYESNKYYNDKRWVIRGSYTVEAALIMGFVFLMIAAVLYMSSFLYGRACLIASAYEQAFTGREQEEYGLFGFGEIEKRCLFGEEERMVSYQGTCFFAWGGFETDMEVKAEVKIEKPVSFLRKWNQLQNIIE